MEEYLLVMVSWRLHKMVIIINKINSEDKFIHNLKSISNIE
ncbi:hypothetical protein [Clostridium sp.]|nr:hypothetical protein [Clostridium sp.]MDR3598325.1 hypothetical protein [Clostridium sp.]